MFMHTENSEGSLSAAPERQRQASTTRVCRACAARIGACCAGASTPRDDAHLGHSPCGRRRCRPRPHGGAPRVAASAGRCPAARAAGFRHAARGDSPLPLSVSNGMRTAPSSSHAQHGHVHGRSPQCLPDESWQWQTSCPLTTTSVCSICRELNTCATADAAISVSGSGGAHGIILQHRLAGLPAPRRWRPRPVLHGLQVSRIRICVATLPVYSNVSRRFQGGADAKQCQSSQYPQCSHIA